VTQSAQEAVETHHETARAGLGLTPPASVGADAPSGTEADSPRTVRSADAASQPPTLEAAAIERVHPYESAQAEETSALALPMDRKLAAAVIPADTEADGNLGTRSAGPHPLATSAKLREEALHSSQSGAPSPRSPALRPASEEGFCGLLGAKALPNGLANDLHIGFSKDLDCLPTSGTEPTSSWERCTQSLKMRREDPFDPFVAWSPPMVSEPLGRDSSAQVSDMAAVEEASRHAAAWLATPSRGLFAGCCMPPVQDFELDHVVEEEHVDAARQEGRLEGGDPKGRGDSLAESL